MFQLDMQLGLTPLPDSTTLWDKPLDRLYQLDMNALQGNQQHVLADSTWSQGRHRIASHPEAQQR
jgi:hypothetical protein